MFNAITSINLTCAPADSDFLRRLDIEAHILEHEVESFTVTSGVVLQLNDSLIGPRGRRRSCLDLPRRLREHTSTLYQQYILQLWNWETVFF